MTIIVHELSGCNLKQSEGSGAMKIEVVHVEPGPILQIGHPVYCP